MATPPPTPQQPKKPDPSRDLDHDGDVDLADDRSRDLDHDGGIDGADREENDIDNDQDIDSSDRSIKEKNSVGSSLGWKKDDKGWQRSDRSNSQQQGRSTSVRKTT